jgi:hypothetical protein
MTKAASKLKEQSKNVTNPINQAEINKNLITIGVFILLVYLFNNLYYTYSPHIQNETTQFFGIFLKNIYNHGEIPLISKNFINCLWAINLFLFVSILGYFSLLIYTQKLYKKLVFVCISILGILAISVVYVVFPFKIGSGAMIMVVKVLLIVIGTGVIVNLFRLLFKRA